MRFLIPGLLAVAATTLSDPALAYIGPGAGISLLGAFWGLLVAVFAAIGVVVWYPLRKLLRGRSAQRPAAQQTFGAEPARVRTR